MEYNPERSIQPGRNFNTTESANPPTVANNAALEVDFFQKNPRINMAKIPGETNPVYSWMYWNPPFSIPRCGAMITARMVDTIMVVLPIFTSWRSEASLLIIFL